MKTETEYSPEKAKILFSSLVLSLGTQAMAALGKITHPVTGKIEKDLDQVGPTIEMIEMLEMKTRGNLSREEELLITQTLSNLKLNYVEEINAPTQEPPKEVK